MYNDHHRLAFILSQKLFRAERLRRIECRLKKDLFLRDIPLDSSNLVKKLRLGECLLGTIVSQ